MIAADKIARAEGSDGAPPGKHTGLSVTLGVYSASWTAPSDTGSGGGGISKYGLQCKWGGGDPTNAGESTSTSANFANLPVCAQDTLNTGNYYRVRVFNLIWGAWSDWYQIQ